MSRGSRRYFHTTSALEEHGSLGTASFPSLKKRGERAWFQPFALPLNCGGIPPPIDILPDTCDPNIDTKRCTEMYFLSLM